MNIVIREIYANKKALIIWSVSMIAFLAMMFAEFAAYYKNPEMLAVIEAMPREMLEAFGMAEANLTTVSGYLSVAVIFINLALGTYAITLGNGIIAKEERDKTAGFLITLPVKRNQILSGKLAAAAISCLILLAVVAASIVLIVTPYEVEECFYRYMLLVLISTYIIMLLFLSIGMFLAASIRRHKISSGIGFGLIFTLYLASIIAPFSDSTRFLEHLTPFMFFEASQILRDLNIDFVYVLASVLIICFALIGTYVIYRRRDLYI
jgi:ABC-2 type transport system permease protein